MKPYAFDLERSARGLRLNRFLHSLAIAGKRKLLPESPEEAMKSLSEDEKDMEKLARTKGVSNPEMVAAFRGETLEQFLKTRKVPGAR